MNHNSDEVLGRPLSVYADRIVTESIFAGATHIIPLADVSYIRKHEAMPSDGGFPGIPEGIIVCLKSFSSTIFLHGDEAAAFLRSWCTYRRELEGGHAGADTGGSWQLLAEPSPFEQLKAKIQADSDLAWLWHRDIALCHTSYGEAGLIDGEARHKAAHSGAARFMRLRFGVDTTQHPDYPRQA